MYFCQFNDRRVRVCAEDGRMVRQVTFSSPVVSAQMSGENFVVQTADRYTYLYALDGRLIRKVRG